MEIKDKSGHTLYKHEDTPGKSIIGSVALQDMREMLRGVVEFGSGRAANVDPTVAGKTGSNGDIDAWFFGYKETPSENNEALVVGVWTGNDSNRPMAKISTGSRMPTRIAGAFFKQTPVKHQTRSGNKTPVTLDDYLKGL